MTQALREKIANAIEADFYAIYRGDKSFNDTANAIIDVIADSVDFNGRGIRVRTRDLRFWRSKFGSLFQDSSLKISQNKERTKIESGKRLFRFSHK